MEWPLIHCDDLVTRQAAGMGFTAAVRLTAEAVMALGGEVRAVTAADRKTAATAGTADPCKPHVKTHVKTMWDYTHDM